MICQETGSLGIPNNLSGDWKLWQEPYACIAWHANSSLTATFKLDKQSKAHCKPWCKSKEMAQKPFLQQQPLQLGIC